MKIALTLFFLAGSTIIIISYFHDKTATNSKIVTKQDLTSRSKVNEKAEQDLASHPKVEEKVGVDFYQLLRWTNAHRPPDKQASEEEFRAASSPSLRTPIAGPMFMRNPYMYQNQVVNLSEVWFKRMYDENTAILGVHDLYAGVEAEILLTGVDPHMFVIPGQYTTVKVKVIGMTEGRNAFGGPIRIPHVHNIDY